MNKLLQLIYISRSNLPDIDRKDIIAPQIAQILSKSRHNNRAKGIVGALYYGNGYFYQCLEGNEQDLLELFERLKEDVRHTDLRIISSKTIARTSFGQWEMKYIPAEQDVNRMLQKFGKTEFDPYDFDRHMHKRMLQLLLDMPESELDDHPHITASMPKVLSAEQGRAWQFATLALFLLLCADLMRQLT